MNSRQSKWWLNISYFLISTPVLAFFFVVINPAIMGAGLVVILPALVIAICGIYRVITYYFTEFSITNKKVLAKSGIFSRKVDELQIKKVEGVDVSQGLIERMLGYGTLVMSGTGTQKVCFYGIDNPIDVKKKINSIL